MSRFVIDTNVPIVANGRFEDDLRQPTDACQLAALEFLDTALKKHIILLDDAGEIQSEYARYLNPVGQPGVGDRFLLEIINSHPDRILREPLEKDGNGEFVDLPQPLIDCNFDPSDRKFAALASKCEAVVANATDSDWVEAAEAIQASGISVSNLCGCLVQDWFN
ncbi:MAG: hypothetical protein IE925_07040 [Rhodobacterales bacterium]|nr:hypothetical protein [Rhodobacterales bacterium]